MCSHCAMSLVMGQLWKQGGTRIISFPKSLALQCSNSQVSVLIYRVGNIFLPPKVQLLTLAMQLIFPVSRNPICSIEWKRSYTTPKPTDQKLAYVYNLLTLGAFMGFRDFCTSDVAGAYFFMASVTCRPPCTWQ